LEPSACSIYREEFSDTVAIVFGNEARGVSEEIATLSDKTITIPRFGSGESLNVAMSAAIILSELARKKDTESGKKGKPR
jgi:tRNA G18 (ribose-2'-O)-methylase SpoU